MSEQVLWKAGEIQAPHGTYTMRRLGIEEVVDIGNLWKSLNTRASVIATTMVGKGLTIEGQALSYFILTALPYESAAIKKMLSGIIGKYDGEDEDGIPVFVPIGKKLSNPEIFPLSSLGQVIEQFAEHADVVHFFDSIKKATEESSLAEILAVEEEEDTSDEASTGSSETPDGPTNMSEETPSKLDGEDSPSQD